MRRSSARGFTLLEVLVSILVLSIGVIGMVGLQAASLQVSRDSGQQAAAVRLASELGEMMRANPYASLAATSPYLMNTFNAVPAFTANCFANPCANANLVAQSDVSDWLLRLRGSDAVDPPIRGEVPGAHVVVCSDSAPYTAAGIPRWACTAGGPIVVKIGWTRAGLDRSRNNFDVATVPSVVVALTPGPNTNN